MVRFSRPIHPGEILREEFLAPLDMSPYALAKALDVPRTRIERIVTEKVGITGDTALRLSQFFDTTPDLWLGMQAAYEIAAIPAETKTKISTIQPLQMAAAAPAEDQFATEAPPVYRARRRRLRMGGPAPKLVGKRARAG